MTKREVLFEGMSEDQILSLPAEMIEGLALVGEPLVFRAGSATVLGSFCVKDNSLLVELAQIDGGGEGVLMAIGSLARRYADLRGLFKIEWIVHAVTCAKPNLRLRAVLEKRGFIVDDVAGVGPAYRLTVVL